ncbi:TrbL/VirB6 plasmid conjugal transfer protein [Serratia fonticola]|uniref:type IV secretion system protein n=1 Tax=Serratia fonticola TaxID=47917 RepID=UPI00217C5C40|nr:type IV secretion system protein [Serratia fonticola]CAI1544480.1 TrbL/VirB6 plasmid conjugal transfer protein [Serratia fonticola]
MDGFFVKYNNDIMDTIRRFGDLYQSEYANGVMTLATASVTIYLLWQGYRVLAGKTQTPLPDIAWDITRFAIILAFVTNAGGYLTMATGALQGLKDGFSGSTTVWQTLDNLWASTQKLADSIYALDTSTYVPAEGWLGMVLVWLGSIALMIISALVYTSADITMSLLAITAPIFIFCLMWGFLRTMFNNWLQLMFSSILTVLFATLVIKIAMSYLSEILSQVSEQAFKGNIVTMGAMGCVAGILAALLVYKAAAIAQQLAGVGVEGAVQGIAMMGLGGAGMAATKTLNASRKLAGSAGSTATNSHKRAWSNAQAGAQKNNVAQARESLLKRKRNAA